MGVSVVSHHKKAKALSRSTIIPTLIIMKSLVIFAVVIAIAVAKAHPGVHRSGGYSHSSSSHGSSYGSPHSSSSHSSPHSTSSHKVHRGKRSAEPEPAKYGHSTSSYNCETVYETVYEKQCETKYVTEYQKECHTVYEEKCET